MLFYLFPILWGALFALILCAPYNYYLLFSIIFVISIVVFFYTRKFNLNIKSFSYIIALLVFFITYSLCSFVIFDSKEPTLTFNKNISSKKEALIFYCNGEMDKYSPQYANCLMKDVNFALKPFYALQIKKAYKSYDSANRNTDILMIAKDVKNSALNFKPFYFYVAFSSYYPDIYASIQRAIDDGCASITIINYSYSGLDEKELPIKEIKNAGITLKITAPIYETPSFAKAIASKISNMNSNFDGILLIDNLTKTSREIKDGLINLGLSDKSILISNNINSAIEYFKQNNKSNILYINLIDKGFYTSEVLLPQKFQNYSSEMKITGINSWGYDKYLVKAVIELLKAKE